MSDFSVKCRQLLQEGAHTVYGFAAACNLDRTTLQRMVTGKRLPSKEFVLRFCQGLHLSADEQVKLIELYDMEFYGKNTVLQRRIIKELLENIQHMETMNLPAANNTALSPEIPPQLFPVQTSNRLEVQQLIFNFIRCEASQKDSVIYTNISPVCHTFFEHLMLTASDPSKNIRVYHTFNLIKNHSGNGDFSYNLETFKTVIPFALNTFCHYEAYYHYVSGPEKELKNILYPYYIIGSAHILWISEDFSCAYIQNNKEEIGFHRENFLQSLSYYTPLFKRTNPLEAMGHYVKCLETFGMPDYSLEAQPCVAYMVPKDLWSQFFIKNEFFSSELERLTCQARDFVLSHNIKKAMYHTLDGTKAFAKNGCLTGDVSLFTKNFSLPERIQMLETLCQNIRDGIANYIITPQKLSFPQTTHIDCFGSRGILFYNFNRIENFCYFFIDETTLCLAFDDFLSVFLDNGYALSKENTLAELEKIISCLKAQIL